MKSFHFLQSLFRSFSNHGLQKYTGVINSELALKMKQNKHFSKADKKALDEMSVKKMSLALNL